MSSPGGDKAHPAAPPHAWGVLRRPMRETTQFAALLLFSLALVAGVTACAGSAGTQTHSSGSRTTAPNSATNGTATSTTAPGDGADPVLSVAATDFVGHLSRGEYPAAVATFDDTMRAALPEGKLRQTWEELVRQVGSYVGATGTRGELSGAYRVIHVTTEFEQATLDVKVVYDAQGRVAGLFFAPAEPSSAYEPPPYVDRTRFTEREVTVGRAPWALPGTLTLPAAVPGTARGESAGGTSTTAGGGASTTTPRRPAVVLVHGSGPNDRDESVGGAKPFRDLAWGLASKGVVVLRYDKRTKVYPQQFAALPTFTADDETVDDAVAAADLLRTLAEVDPTRVFVLGHSLGGTMIPRIGARLPRAAGFMVMAGATRPLEDLILEQSTYLASLGGIPTAAAQQQLDELRLQVARVKDPALSPTTPAGELPLGIPAPYWLDLRGYEPAAAAAKLPQPLLVLQGARDYQVTTADFDLWKAALDGKAGTKLILYPDLNHLFETGAGKSTPAEYEVAGHVDAKVIGDIAGWVGGTGRP